MFSVYDYECKEHTFGPVWLDVPDMQSDCPWDWLGQEETEAAKILQADLECKLSFEHIHDEPPQKPVQK